MSATFIADGRDAVVLGFNEQIVAALGTRPYVYRGVLGPVPVDSAAAREVEAAVRACTEAFALRGLASLDFLLDEGRVLVLEVNPRPPASLALYPRVGDAGPLCAHLRACIDARLPATTASAGLHEAIAGMANSGSARATVSGNEIVYAPHSFDCDAATAQQLALLPDTHDLPRGATRFAAGEPVCSVSARGATAATVRSELARRRTTLLRFLVESAAAFPG
jgi:predicted ATP-grasp superfamily ATP-dependent carboligase